MVSRRTLRLRRRSFALVGAMVLASVLVPAPAIASGHLILFATTSHYNNFTRIDVTFGAPVFNATGTPAAPGGNLTATDFVHTGTADIQSVAHTAGDETAVIVMNGPVAEGDTLAAAANAIFDPGDNPSATTPVEVFPDLDWVTCGASVSGETITTECISAFQQDGGAPLSPDLQPGIFEAADLLQIQVWDVSREGETPDQYDLVGGGGLLTANSEVRINLDLDDFDPIILIGTGDLVSYTTSAPGASSHTLDIVAKPKGSAYKEGCWTEDEAACAGNADFDNEGSLSFAAIPAAFLADDPGFAAAARGMTIMTNAQGFSFPWWDETEEALTVQVAAPSNLSNGSPNVGFFEAFIPNGMFGADFFNIDPGAAVFSATSGAAGVSASATLVAGGVKISLIGLTYSAPTIRIHADPEPPAPVFQPPPPPPPPAPDLSEGIEVDAGETVTTDPEGTGPTAESPVQVAVTTPAAGTVSVDVDEDGQGADAPEGFRLFGQQVTISAPAATPEDPLELEFDLHDSQLPEGVTSDDVVVFRNGAPVPDCTGAAGVADPDPCVAGRESGENGLSLTVLTSQASTWNFGVALPPPVFHERRVGLRAPELTLNPRTIAFEGKVSAPTSWRCRRHVHVKLQRLSEGRWVTLTRTATNRRDSYRILSTNVPGRYRAVVPRLVWSDSDDTRHICPRAVSPVRRHSG